MLEDSNLKKLNADAQECRDVTLDKGYMIPGSSWGFLISSVKVFFFKFLSVFKQLVHVSIFPKLPELPRITEKYTTCLFYTTIFILDSFVCLFCISIH